MDSSQSKQERHEARQAAFAKYERALRKSVRMARDHTISNEEINTYVASAREQWEKEDGATSRKAEPEGSYRRSGPANSPQDTR